MVSWPNTLTLQKTDVLYCNEEPCLLVVHLCSFVFNGRLSTSSSFTFVYTTFESSMFRISVTLLRNQIT